jgi:hypothetical protein
LRPQQVIRPPVIGALEWASPATTAVAPDSPGTRTGAVLFVVVPVPPNAQ